MGEILKIYTLMVIYTKETLSTDSGMEKDCISLTMGTGIRGDGRTIIDMAPERKPSPLSLKMQSGNGLAPTRESGSKIKNMEKEYLLTPIKIGMRVTGRTTRNMDMEFMSTLLKTDMKGNFRKIICMDKGS